MKRALWGVLWVLLLPASVAWAVPNEITYSGRLEASNGLPYDGEVAAMAHVYDTLSGGTPLFSQDMGDVIVESGLFRITLSGATLQSVIQTHDNLWIEFELDGETMAPRQRLTSVPYASISGDTKRVGGVLAGEFVKKSDPITETALPTNSLDRVSNGAMSNEFKNVTAAYVGTFKNIMDAPDPAATLTFNTAETGDSYITSLTVYTQYSLTFGSFIQMVLTPPASSGLGAITLVNDSAKINPGSYAQSWTPGNTPALTALLGKKLSGVWTLSIIDTTDDAAPGTSVGKLEGFSLNYDVVRSDHIGLSGKLDVSGDLTVGGHGTFGGNLVVGGNLTTMGTAMAKPIMFDGWCVSHGGSDGVLIPYCLDGKAGDPPAGWFSVDAALGEVTVLQKGWYTITWYTWNRNNCGTRHDAYLQVNGNTLRGSETRVPANLENMARLEGTLLLNANDKVRVMARSNCSSTEPHRSFYAGPTWSHFNIKHAGTP
ncbi:MAG: hypothetical protein HUU55_00120 [Myxococcales bacterium]|nr:hypothetical protein [Myxococcales bacterium]